MKKLDEKIVIVDWCRSAFVKASPPPIKTKTFRNLYGEEKYRETVADMMSAHNVSKADAEAYLNMPFVTPPATEFNKIGKFAHISPMEMFIPLVNHLIEKTGINPDDIESAIAGVVHQEGEQGLNFGRLSVIDGGSLLPMSVQGDTVDKFCASSLRAVDFGIGDLVRGNAKIILAGGAQSMSRVQVAGANSYINQSVADANRCGWADMGATAEYLNEIQETERKEQEEFSLLSHKKAAAARDAGYFKDEIVPIAGIKNDDCIRDGSEFEADVRDQKMRDQMKKLKPAFFSERNDGKITAATSSPLTDGASAMVLTTESYALANHLPYQAEIVATAGAGVAPEHMGIGPVFALKKALERANISAEKLGVVEWHEAFCGQVLSCLKEAAAQGMAIPLDIVNKDGGATAIGHPFGATGVRILGHLSSIMIRENIEYGAATMCVGEGQAMSAVLRNPHYKANAPRP